MAPDFINPFKTNEYISIQRTLNKRIGGKLHEERSCDNKSDGEREEGQSRVQIHRDRAGYRFHR